MAELITNTFSTFSLSDEEALQGSILTVTQKQVIQNKLAEVAEEKLALEVDSKDIDFFLQQEASLKGQLDILRWLLEAAEAAEETVNELLRNPDQNQNT